VRSGESGHNALTAAAHFIRGPDLQLDLGAELEHGVGIPPKEAALLLLEQAEEAAVFRDFAAKDFDDVFPRKWS